MIIINYWTSQYFETNIWDKYYCKTIHSAKKKLKELLKKDDYSPSRIEKALTPLSQYIFDKKTCFSPWSVPNLECMKDNKDFWQVIFVWLSEEYLF